MWEEVCEQVLRQDANVSFDVVVQNQSCRNGRFVLPAPSFPLPMGQINRCQRGHGFWSSSDGSHRESKSESKANDSYGGLGLDWTKLRGAGLTEARTVLLDSG